MGAAWVRDALRSCWAPNSAAIDPSDEPRAPRTFRVGDGSAAFEVVGVRCEWNPLDDWQAALDLRSYRTDPRASMTRPESLRSANIRARIDWSPRRAGVCLDAHLDRVVFSSLQSSMCIAQCPSGQFVSWSVREVPLRQATVGRVAGLVHEHALPIRALANLVAEYSEPFTLTFREFRAALEAWVKCDDFRRDAAWTWRNGVRDLVAFRGTDEGSIGLEWAFRWPPPKPAPVFAAAEFDSESESDSEG